MMLSLAPLAVVVDAESAERTLVRDALDVLVAAA